LKALGVTTVHLLPSYDFKTVDELKVDDPASTAAKFNWGYDPQNYNVPEGSYSTNPSDPGVRITEFKEMVQALHDQGIRVVMDVVYNHTFSIDGGPFNKIVPGYYYRTTDAGSYTNATGVGNEVASERPMVSKYIVDSVKYWAEEYNVDGFRFDLMGLIDIDTMKKVTNELHEQVDPSLIVYGEPWDMGPTTLPQEKKTIKGTQKDQGFAVFNDDIRGAIKGDSDGSGKGFATGQPGLEVSIVTGMKGATDSFASRPSESINYITAHDNLNLWDKIIATQGKNAELGMLNLKDGELVGGGSIEAAVASAQPYKGVGSGETVFDNETVRRSLLANGIVLTSQGIPFLHAGDEMLRTKYGDHNSYRSPDVINQISWSNVDNFNKVFDYYQGLIELRKNHPAFRMSSKEAIAANLQVLKSDGNVVSFELKNYANGDTWKNIVVIYNANNSDQTVTLPSGSEWNIVVNDKSAGIKKLGSPVAGSVSVPKLSVMVLYDVETAYTPVVTSIDLSPKVIGLEAGTTRILSALVRDQKGNAMPSEKIVWSSSGPHVATVTAKGVVTAVHEGTATITASVGQVSARITVHVGELIPAELSVTGPNQVYATQSASLTATVKDQYGQVLKGKTISWSSSDDSVATVNSSGEVQGVKQGAVTITARIGSLQAEHKLSVLPFVKKTVQLRYTRPDQNYQDWNLWIWGTGGVSDGQVNFTVKNGVAIANIETSPDTSSVGFIVRKGEDWNTAKQDIPDDRSIPLKAGQTFVKVNVTSMVKEVEILPDVNGPVMDDGNIAFYYRDDSLFRQGQMDTIQSLVLNVKFGSQEKTYSMTYDARNEYFTYTLQNVEQGTYYYDFTVKRDGKETTLPDTNNPNRDGDKSYVVFYKPDLKVQAEILPDKLASGITYNDNAVLKLTVTSNENVRIREAYADLTELGGGSKEIIDPLLLERTISVKDSVTAGKKTVAVTVVDEFGNKHTATILITVKTRSGQGALDFDWDEARIYFLLTDRFHNGDPSNDNPNGIPGSYDPSQPETYHGGDIRGIIEKLDYLEQLGVNTIWISPIVDNIDFDVRHGQNGAQFAYHGYWATNFEAMDEHLGDVEDLKELIDQAHDRGIKIMVDVVLNHAGYGMKEGDTGNGVAGYPTAEGQSRFAGMLRAGGTDTVQGELDGLPDFMTEIPEVRDKLIDWQVNWLNKARTRRGDTIDFFRVDTVKHVDQTTWMAFKNELTKVVPNFKLIGEYFGGSVDNTGGYWGNGQMDSLLDFQFKTLASDFVNGKVNSVEKVLEQRNGQLSNDRTLGQFLSSHDEDGFLSEVVNGDIGKLKLAAALLMTSKGQPVIYYGEELGQSGKTAGDMNAGQFSENRDDMPWDKVDNKDPIAMDIHDHYAKLLHIRAKYSKVFAKGTHSKLAGSDEDKYLIFARAYNGTTAIVGLNTDNAAAKATFTAPFAAGTVLVDEYRGGQYTVSKNGQVTVTIPGKDQGGTVILAAKQGDPKPPTTNPGQTESSAGTGSVNTGSHATDSTVQVADHLTSDQGVITVNVSPGVTTVHIPVSEKALDGTNVLLLKSQDFTLKIPADVLKQLLATAGGDQQKGTYISVQLRPLSLEEANELLKLVAAREGAAITKRSILYDFGLSVISTDGSIVALEQLASPLTLTMPLILENAWSGVYQIGEHGELTYIGATSVIEGISVQLARLGVYGMLTYEKSFADVPAGHWAEDAIRELAARGIIKGVTAKKFAPAADVSRAEFTAMLVRALELKSEGQGSFSDVPAAAWYAADVTAASEAGIITGRGDGTFAGDRAVSREEMAVMLIRAYSLAMGEEPDVATSAQFNDGLDIASYARSYVNQASALGLLKGRSSGKFAPKSALTRAECAQVIVNLLHSLNK
jgi:pullulanase